MHPLKLLLTPAIKIKQTVHSEIKQLCMLCGCLLTALQCTTLLWLFAWQTCEGMDHSPRSNDERAGDEQVVDEEQVQEYLQGHTRLLSTLQGT